MNANLVLSSYPYELAIEEGLLDAGRPRRAADDIYSACDRDGNCGAWIYLQGTSMASPHVAGEAALVDPGPRPAAGAATASLRTRSARSSWRRPPTTPARPAGVEIYTDEGRPPEFNAVCEGTTAVNGLYGEGIINATAAVARPA